MVAPVALDDSTPYWPQVRASFGAFGRNENGYAQAIDRYRDFARKFRCQPKSSELSSEPEKESFGQGKGLTNLDLSQNANDSHLD